MSFTAGQKLRASMLNAPFGHAAPTSGFISIAAANGAYPTLVAQTLTNGMTLANNQLVVPKAGLYEISAKGYFTGSSGYVGRMAATINTTALPPAGSDQAGGQHQTWKGDANDYTNTMVVRRQLAAGDAIGLWLWSTQSTYGTSGYDGCWLEVLYIQE